MVHVTGNGKARQSVTTGANGGGQRPAFPRATAGSRTESDIADMYLLYELQRRAYQLREAFTIGRDTTSDLVVLEPTVSRTHARVNSQDQAFFLENLGATGTRVNGVRLEQVHQLTYGDRIEIGTAVLTVRSNPLPLGVSLERPRSDSLDMIAARRPTIRHPLISERIVERPHEWGKWMVMAVAGALIAALLLRG
ncbi:MAG TPA: FHA domain-containing protein [Gemmatimonadaceae bacterium]|nr:FHA domain-containing protein [Gemmatimonadaceae bacterium]